VQGMDYYYTLQGWIKGVNMPYAGDPGADGLPAGMNSVVGKDVFAYSLGYFQNDYAPINAAMTTVDSRDQLWTRALENIQHAGLYNGNISWMETDLADITSAKADRTKGMQAMMYRYDQLHRIVKSRSLTSYIPLSTGEGQGEAGFAPRPTTAAYDEDYSYDPNGNILTLNRNDETATLKDDFDYKYYNKTNRLQQHKTNGGLYQYDAIGNLINDGNEGTIISWTPYGKVRTVHKGDSITVNYFYDAAGNRVEKKVIKSNSTVATRYLRDASGNVMSIYKDTTLTEVPIYGSSRIGQYNGGVPEGERILGKRNFELSNHLGNVLSVISDNVGMKADSVWATVISSSDYYPFGLEMKGRTYSDTVYRYGFNGKEKDKSFASTTDYDYGFRIYNPSIAKFLSVDPLTTSYPMLTPYQFASNVPIAAIDLDGLESKFVMQWLSQPHGDGTRTVIKTEALVKPNLVHPQVYAAGLAGKVAVTETYYYDNNNNYLGTDYYYEAINEGWPKPSAFYDYTKGAVQGKGADDREYAGVDPGRWALILGRDASAPDNAGIIEDLEVLTASQGLPMFGRWTRTTEAMSAEAAAYQKQITGRSADRSYLLNGTKFDGVKNGTLIDAKSGYSNFVNRRTGEFHSWFKGSQGLVDQARRQLKAAGGNSIQWHFENKSVRDATERLFKKEGISGIDLKYTPKKK